ncbi:hypothetical protein JOD57_001962 [Geodermatophilus bullaregiensis]|uniref:LmeA family phospholipid-binding protein n=1 Tax=Geodermatophilus bullaregiensis TaxID=1564160 RepID=UPI00195D6E58|nr:DUF2993 domain-containing protein [Geodermatophilus bullaregiensis]MBM7806125.1 hypothetical protein [Geodermatophilus bullaregiensis]
MRAVLGVLVLLVVVLGGVALVADPVAEGMAEDRVAVALQDAGALAGTPQVDITGWPFLTQAVAGTYDEVRIGLTAADLGQPEGTRADVTLRGVHVPLSDALSGSVQEVPVDRVDGTATLSYALLSRELGADTTLERAGDGLRVTRTVEVLGYTVPLTAVGGVVLEGDELVIEVEDAEAAGVGVPDFVVDRAVALLDLRYPVRLPFGLQLTGVTPADDGVDVAAQATDTVFRPS